MKKLAAVLCLLAPLAAKADEKPALTQYLNMRSTGAPSLSPDGSHSAFLWSVTGTAQV